MTARRNLINVANGVLSYTMQTGRTGQDIRRKFDLNERQFVTVKRYAKRISGLERGLIWAYDPYPNESTGKYRFCPSNAPLIAERMIGYAISSWHDEGASFEYLLQGAMHMGFIGEGGHRNAVKQTQRARRAILTIHRYAKIPAGITADMFDLAAGPE